MDKALRRARRKTALRGIATLLGLARRGFFVPYRHAAGLPERPPPYAAFEEAFNGRKPAMQQVLDRIEEQAAALADAASGPLRDHWTGAYFGPLDSAVAWVMVQAARPARIVEVGSGSSTHVLCRAAATLETRPEITCIDPVPRAEISALNVSWEERVLSEAQIGIFEELGAGDIAFFDSSHVLHQGTDVDIIVNRILPVLAPGVVVHVHDIFLPDPYPESWSYRAYSEQLAFSGWLLSGACEILFGCHYAGTRMKSAVARAMDGLPVGARSGGSLWFRR